MIRGKKHPLAGLARRAFGTVLRGPRLPITEGRMRLPGLRGRVVINRDRWSIPHIRARHEADAWFALGFCQSQDRSFQLSLLARVATGRLAEMIGAEGLRSDRLARRIGFAVRAPGILAAQSEEVRDQIEAFAAGLRTGVQRGRKDRDPAFVLARAQPWSFDALDVVAVMQLQAFALSSNWDAELARLEVLQKDGAEALVDLDPVLSPFAALSGASPGPGTPLIDAFADDVAALRTWLALTPASNNWVIGPERTASGRPLLANDPHLAPGLPSPWYLAHLECEGFNAAGATMVGLPAIASGHNGHGAWGVTAGLCDNVDLFVHEIEDGRTRREQGWVECERRREVIFVRGQDPVVEQVLETPEGPIVSPALEGRWPALSMRATWLEARPIRGLLEIHHARSFSRARECLRNWPVMPLGVVWGDVEGDYGWVMAAEVPRRAGGKSLLPGVASRAQGGWLEIEDGTRMPFEHAPPRGFAFSANQQPPTTAETPHLGFDFMDGYRAARIEEALEQREDWDVFAAMRLQLDVESLPWRELRAPLLGVLVGAEFAALRARLANWDGLITADSAEASVFELWVAEMCTRVARARAPRAYAWALGHGPNPLLPHAMLARRRVSHLVGLLEAQPEQWFEAGWAAEMAEAMRTTLERLRREFGSDWEDWRWGALRPLVLRHPISRGAPALAPLFDRGPYACGGDSHTLAQSSVTPLDPLGDPANFPSMRMVVDVGEFERARFCIAGGQSGNPLSPHYDDQIELWLRGQGVPIAYGRAAVENAAVERLELLPERQKR